VVELRVTLVTLPEVTVPTPLSMAQVGAGAGVLANVQLQVTSVGLSSTTDGGEAENVAMIGATGAEVVVIVVSAVSLPASFVHVRTKVVSADTSMVVIAPFEMPPTPPLI
jgi:hypothetical protein